MSDVLPVVHSFIIFVDYKIVIICSNEEEEKSNIIAKLQTYRRPYQGIKADGEFMEYLKSYFIPQTNLVDENGVIVKAAAVDIDKYDIVLYCTIFVMIL